MKAPGINAGGDHLGTITTELGITGVLQVRFLLRAGDHQICLGESQLFRFNASAHGVSLFNLLAITATGQKTTLLFPPERMTGEHQGETKPLAHQSPDKSRVGVVGMDPIHRMTRLGEVMHQLVSKILQVRPKLFLAQITFRTKGKTQDSSAWSNHFHRTRIVSSNPTVLHKTSHHIDPLNLGTLGQAADQIQDIQRLTASVRITTELKIPGPEQTVQVQMKDANTPSHSSDPLNSSGIGRLR